MTLLLPQAEVRYRSIYRIDHEFPRLADLVAGLADCDAVFAASFETPFADGGGFAELRARLPVIQIPILVFSAFHPDLVYVVNRNARGGSRHVQTPLASYNSALALYGFLSDFTVEETLRLFNREAFRTLAYLDMWEPAMAAFLDLGRQAGYDLEESVLRWSRRGAFMHSVNHPKMFVACDLARGLLRKAAIPFTDFDIEAFVIDELVQEGTYPVYPEVGEIYGAQGGYVFVARARRTGEILRVLTLRDFVAGSFASYARRRRADFDCARVDAWRANEALAPLFRDWAGRA